MLNGNTGDHSEKLRTSDADKDDVLLNSVEDRLANLNELTSPKASEDLEEDSNPDEVVEEEENKEDDQEVSEKDDEDSISEEEDKDEEVKDDKKVDDVKIPYALEQAAMRSGWSKEDIDDAVKTNPEKAKKMFNNLYNSLNQASREFSALGRAKVKTNTTDVGNQDGFQGVDIAKLKEEYEDNPIIDGVVAPLNNALKKMMSEVTELKNARAQEPVRSGPAGDDLATKQAIDSFFNSDSMKPYNKVYGKTELGQDWNILQGDQHTNRWSVLKEADAIIAGYSAIGQHISVDEALERAHLVVTEPIREQIIREGIKQSVTKRSKSITMRPSKSTRTSTSGNKFNSNGKPRSKDELEQQVSEKLLNIFH